MLNNQYLEFLSIVYVFKFSFVRKGKNSEMVEI